MREVKFRARDTDNNVWLFGGQSFTIGQIASLTYNELPNFGTNIEWVQYTGLKDGKGNLIYEGDIIKPIDGNTRKENREVGFNDGSFTYSYVGHLKEKYVGALNHSLAGLYEVIGNIYENPELLT